MLRSIGKQSVESVESVRKKKRRLRSEGFAKKGRVFSLFAGERCILWGEIITI